MESTFQKTVFCNDFGMLPARVIAYIDKIHRVDNYILCVVNKTKSHLGVIMRACQCLVLKLCIFNRIISLDL